MDRVNPLGNMYRLNPIPTHSFIWLEITQMQPKVESANKNPLLKGRNSKNGRNLNRTNSIIRTEMSTRIQYENRNGSTRTLNYRVEFELGWWDGSGIAPPFNVMRVRG